MPLYLTAVPLDGPAGVSVVARGDGAARFAMKLHFGDGTSRTLPLPAASRWARSASCIAGGRGLRLTRISVVATGGGLGRDAALNLGEIAVSSGCPRRPGPPPARG